MLWTSGSARAILLSAEQSVMATGTGRMLDTPSWCAFAQAERSHAHQSTLWTSGGAHAPPAELRAEFDGHTHRAHAQCGIWGRSSKSTAGNPLPRPFGRPINFRQHTCNCCSQAESRVWWSLPRTTCLLAPSPTQKMRPRRCSTQPQELQEGKYSQIRRVGTTKNTEFWEWQLTH